MMGSRPRFLLRLTAASAALAILFAAAAAGGSRSQPDTGAHLMIVPRTPEGIGALARSAARVAARYDAFALVEASGEDVDRLRRAGADRRDDMREVRLARGAFDPASERRSLAAKGHARPAGGLALVQFVGPVKERWLELLRQTGVRIVTYQAQNAYVVHGSGAQLEAVARLVGRDPAVRAAVALGAPDKVEGDAAAPGRRPVTLITVTGEAGADARAQARRAGRELRGESTVGQLRAQYVELDGVRVSSLARDPGVVAVESYVEPELRDERAAQIVGGNLSGGSPSPPGYLAFLSGEGFGTGTFDFAIDFTDEGLDSGSTSTVHPDFSGRVDYVSNWTKDTDGRDCGGHGTNVASIAAGINEGTGSSGSTAVEDSAGYNYGLGVAPRAQIGASKIFRCATGAFQLAGGATLSDLTSSAYANGARVSSNSWGSSDFGGYSADSREYDALVRDAQPATSDFPAAGNQQLVEVFAAGNDGENGYNSVGSPGTAKNVISVGASENVRAIGGTDGCGVPDSGANDARDIIDFSSRGPTNDGRLKPDIVAPGTHVTGASPQHDSYNGSGTCNQQFPAGNTLYSLVSGTSQATPEVSGAAALVRDWYRREHGGGTVVPSPALTKALLVNAAADIAGGSNGNGSTIAGLPNTDQGWGRVDVGELLDGTPREFRDQTDLLGASGASLVKSYAVQDTGKPVKVTLAWTDPPGPTVGNAFVNDLDLVVSAGGRTYKGNVFAGGLSITGGSADPRNNVESVYLPAGTSGRFSVKVVGTAIPGDGVPGNGDSTDQDFALVVSNADEQPFPVLAHDQTTLDDTAGGDGDGALEPGESFELDERIGNLGDSAATSVSGSLSAGSGGLSITQPSSGYPNVAAGGTATNATPFAGSLSAAATCGADVQMTLALNTGQGSYAVPITLGTGVAGPVTARTSSDVPKSIPDNNSAGVTSTLNVPTAGRIKDLDVRISGITHTWVGDLKLELTGPDGTTVVLADQPGGPDNNGDNFTNTVFDDEASTNISAGTPPYTGSFRPQADQLSRFDGKDQQGTWTLRVRDLFAGDVGALTGWGTDTRTATCSSDSSAPDTTIDSGPSGSVASTSATFTFSSSEPGSTFECKLDSNSFAACSSPKEYTGLSQGSHTFEVRARDTAGNPDPTPASRTWTVDTIPPSLTLATPANGSSTSDTTPALSGTAGIAAGDSSTVTVEIWTGSGTSGSPLQARTATRDPSTGAYSVDAAGLAQGTYTARAKQQDGAGNTGFSAANTFTVDTVAPVVTLDSPANGSTLTGSTPALSGTGGTAPGDSPTVTVKIWMGSASLGLPIQTRTATRDPATGAYSVDASPALGDGTYTARAEQVDQAGNIGVSSSTSFTIDTATSDIDPPETMIDSGPSGTVTSTSATFEFSSDEPGSSFECKLDSGSFQPCASPQQYTGLSAGSHTFEVRARDPAGNVDPSPAIRTWTISPSSAGTGTGSGDGPAAPAPLAWALQAAELDLRHALSEGVPVLAGCGRNCTVSVTLTLRSAGAAAVTAGKAEARLSGAGARRVTVLVNSSVRRRLARADEATLRLNTAISQAGIRTLLSRRLELRRRGTRGLAVRRGVPLALRCSTACRMSAKAFLSRDSARALGLTASTTRVLAGRASANLAAAGTASARLRLTRAVRRRARLAPTLGLRLVASLEDLAGLGQRSALGLVLRR